MKMYLRDYCVGCGLCVAKGKAEVQVDRKGYIYPALGDEAWLENVCPAGGKQLLTMDKSKIWGRTVNVYLGWSNDPILRNSASSGGVVTEVAAYLLKSKKVDAIIHVCMDQDNPTSTKVCVSLSREELVARCGSRYAISHPLSCLDDLEMGKKYAFIGKPCDVTVLKNYMQNHPELQSVIPFTLSFFCAGMPSAGAQEKLVDQLGCKEKVVSLRYRGHGWPGFTTAIGESGKAYTMDYNSSWGQILGRDIMRACRFCLDGIGEMADISCGDAWYVTADMQPDFSEHEGRNVIFARSESGNDLLKQLSAAGLMHCEKYENYEKDLKIIQRYQFERKATMLARLLGMRCVLRKVPHIKTKDLVGFSKEVSYIRNLKVFMGTVKRAIIGKI